MLPKVSDQNAYYGRQLYFYNLTVFEGLSLAHTNKQNSFYYIWTKNEYLKGSVLSRHYTISYAAWIWRVCPQFIFFSKGCGGYNKNKIVHFMRQILVTSWSSPISNENHSLLFNSQPLIYPNRLCVGKSRAQEAQEKICHSKSRRVFNDFTTVIRLGLYFNVNKWKSISDKILKSPGQWHLQFQKSRKIVFKPSKATILIQGKPYYNFELRKPNLICKTGKSFTVLNLEMF